MSAVWKGQRQLESRLQGQVVDTYRIRSVGAAAPLQSDRVARWWRKVSAKPHTSHFRDPSIGQTIKQAQRRWCWCKFANPPNVGRRKFFLIITSKQVLTLFTILGLNGDVLAKHYFFQRAGAFSTIVIQSFYFHIRKSTFRSSVSDITIPHHCRLWFFLE